MSVHEISEDYRQLTELFNLSNKLFCTFTSPERLDDTISTINRRYTVMYNKLFVLESPQSDELILTYNIDTANTVGQPMSDTILLHRKKESNTLYTINALNTLIKKLNGGFLDQKYIVDWSSYKNSILLTQGPDIRRLDTSINKIVNFN